MDTRNNRLLYVGILVLVLFFFLACEAPISLPHLGGNSGSVSKGPTKAPIIAATQPRKATATSGWVDTRVQFFDSDCPDGDLPKPTIYVNMGSLTCNYSIEGGSEGMSIKQVDDTDDLQSQFTSSKEYAKQKISDFITKPNAQFSQISNDPEDNFYMITYDGDKTSNNTKTPLCIYAGGNQIVNDKFITGFLLYACSAEKNADDYKAEFESLVESAHTAIDRAGNASVP